MFHENGQLAEELYTLQGKRHGPWLKFFDDGTPELIAENAIDKEVIVHNAWNERREQIVKDGTGIFCEYPAHIFCEHDVYIERYWPRESELKCGVPHGKVTTYERDVTDSNCDVLWSISHYMDGKLHGESTKYWNNGRIRSVTKYANGIEGSSTEFPKFDHPVPVVELSIKANEKLYALWRHIRVDQYPRPLNKEVIQRQFKIPQFLREVNERNLAGTLRNNYEDCSTFADGIYYFLTVDVSGEVTAIKAHTSGVYSGGDWNTYPPLLRKLRFAPGQIRGQAIECRVLAKVDHTFLEHGS